MKPIKQLTLDEVDPYWHRELQSDKLDDSGIPNKKQDEIKKKDE